MMGYIVKISTEKYITLDILQQFKATVLEYKSCPCYLADLHDNKKNAIDPSYLIIVAGSYSLSGDNVRPFVERMIRWFRKIHNIKASADWSNEK